VTGARFPWGNGRRRELANVWVDARSTVTGGTRPVGSFPSSGYGLSDMAGNVWEWCEDRYQRRFPDDVVGGSAAREGWGRVIRGGSWRRSLDMARVSTRSWQDIGYFGDDLGFRCVVDHRAQVSVEDLMRSVRRAFPIRVGTAHELDRARLGQAAADHDIDGPANEFSVITPRGLIAWQRGRQLPLRVFRPSRLLVCSR